jgi:ATP-dependent DNA helicase RecG
MELNTAVDHFPGVGQARRQALERLGLYTAGDLLRYFPRDYEDRTRLFSISAAPEGESVCVAAMVAETPRLSHIRKGLDVTHGKVVDQSAAMTVTFFNQSYVKNALRPGESYIFYGKVEGTGRARQMVNPVFEREGTGQATGRIMPVYPLTHGVSNKFLAGLTQGALAGCLEQVEETLPQALRQEHALAELRYSYENIHFPASFQALELARRRLVFEELFDLSCGLALLKGRRQDARGAVLARRSWEEFQALLPFAPTNAQRRAMEEVCADAASGRPMNRLLQGDVGSGKTAVAAYGAWLAWKSGYQSALMAPTEILAQQHFATLSALLTPAGVRVALLTGSMGAAAKRKVYAALQAGEIDLVVGTHALLSQGVEFARLGLVIVDEQHRFGVAQRSALAGKADLRPHVLVMSATPIPRTLALMIYGDLDLSVLDELPPGRTPVETYLIGEDKRARLYGFVRKLVGEGRQVYLVCPAVEEGEDAGEELKAVTVYARQLQTQVFPDLRVAFVHGKLKAKEKQAVMAAFAAGEVDVLVSTTVIEVGVDVPNAALMVVENADRFGLSQLHQLRGRVGRGKHQSYCVLLSDNKAPETRQRLKTLTQTSDGFRIAEEDLKARGPGDFFGKRQHGLPQLRIADLAGDMRVLKQAQQAAQKLLADDPALQKPENRRVLAQVKRLFAENPDIFN